MVETKYRLESRSIARVQREQLPAQSFLRIPAGRRAAAEHQATLGRRTREWCPWAPPSTPNPWPALGAWPPRPGPPCRPLITAPLCRRSRRAVACKHVAHPPQKQETVWQISMARRDDVDEHLARVVGRQDAPLERPCTHPAADNSLTKLQPPSPPPPLRERAPPRGDKDVGVALCGAVVRDALRRSNDMYSANLTLFFSA